MSDAGISVIFYKIVLISQKNAVDFYSFMNSFITKLFISNRFRTYFFLVIFGVLYNENGNRQLDGSILRSSVSGMNGKKIGEDPFV